MSNPIAISKYNISITNMNWGYQITDDDTNQVLVAVKDTTGGPTRTKACNTIAGLEYKRMANLFHAITAIHQRRILHELTRLPENAWMPFKPAEKRTVKALLNRGKVVVRNDTEMRLAPTFQRKVPSPMIVITKED